LTEGFLIDISFITGYTSCYMRRLTKSDVLKRFNNVHGNKYDYSLVEYINNSTKVKIICLSCGCIISISPSHHFRGQGCKKCGVERFADGIRLPINQFIDKANKTHNGKYDYSLVEYKNKHTKVKIVCPVHGVFEQTPTNHYNYGCNQCGYINAGNKQRIDSVDIAERCKTIHNEKYKYPEFVIESFKDKVKIICPIHGEFEQRIGNHIYKQYGCPKCASHISQQEQELQQWLSQHIDITTNDRTLIAPLELDIIIPSKKIAIEYNGIYWHSEQRGKDKRYHLNKYNLCKENGYRLIQVWENEWLQKKDIVKSILLSAIGQYERKVHGRKCEINRVTTKDARLFYTNNHVQGFQSGKHKGLYYNGELVSLMTIKYYKNTPMLERFANRVNTLVHGAFSKLLKSFDSLDGMVTFSDPRYFTGNVYENNGFEYQFITKPNYWYFKINTLVVNHRRRFQRKKIEQSPHLNFDPDQTEYQNMLANGYDRIWDCGNLKYIYKE